MLDRRYRSSLTPFPQKTPQRFPRMECLQARHTDQTGARAAFRTISFGSSWLTRPVSRLSAIQLEHALLGPVCKQNCRLPYSAWPKVLTVSPLIPSVENARSDTCLSRVKRT